MPGPRRPKERDINQSAFAIVQQATGQVIVGDMSMDGPVEKPEKNPAAVALGKLGGAKGGKARAAALTPKKRSSIAKKAAQARWAKAP